MTWQVLSLTLFLLIAVNAYNEIYHRHHLIQFDTKTQDDVNFFTEHLKQFHGKVKVVRGATVATPSMLVGVASSHSEALRHLALNARITSHVVADDLQAYLTDWMAKNEQQRQQLQQHLSVNSWFESYHDFYEIMERLELKAQECGQRCQLITLNSTSFEGRPLKVLKMGVLGENKPHLWIDAAIHAREWIAPAVAMYFIERFVDDYGVDEEVTGLLDDYNIYIMPVVNPDGYQYTWTHDRLWRKSRLTSEKSDCIGTDLNRNFDYLWDTIGTDDDPCGDAWPGYTPFSDPETRAVSDFLQQENGGDWKLFLNMHSSGQLLMFPWGHTTQHVADYDKLMEAAQVCVDALTAVHGTQYRTGASSHILYYTSGTSRDWSRAVLDVEYPYVLELRDTGEHGFELPADQIQPCAEETWAGLKAFLLHITD